MSENRIECTLCRTGTYPHFGYTGSGVCDHCGAEWAYDETDTLTDNAMRALWEKIPRWIPVTDRLPEMGERVMVCNAVDEWVSIGHRRLTGAYLHWDGDDHEELYEPTHWMPLPAPPKGDR